NVTVRFVEPTRRSRKSILGAGTRTMPARVVLARVEPSETNAPARRTETTALSFIRRTSTAYFEPFQKVAVVVARFMVRATTAPSRTNWYPSAPGWGFQANVTVFGVVPTTRSANRGLGAGTNTSRVDRVVPAVRA